MERLVPIHAAQILQKRAEPKDKMYKGFYVWLRKNYPEGKLTGLQLQSALAEDDEFFYPPANLESQQNSPSYTEMPHDMSQ